MTRVSIETSKIMALNKDIDFNKLAGLLLDEWVQNNLKTQVPAQ